MGIETHSENLYLFYKNFYKDNRLNKGEYEYSENLGYNTLAKMKLKLVQKSVSTSKNIN
jgi:hypothetical protein